MVWYDDETSMIDYSKELNQEQLAVVLMGEGPCLVLAGAGSGKTRVITYRVAYLLEQEVNPENILLLTFTNKAAGEMINRVQKITKSDARLPWAGTFHSIAFKILRMYAPLLGYKQKFTILDSDDSETILKFCVKEFKSDEKKFPSARVLQNIISYARNAEMTLDQVLSDKYPGWLVLEEKIKNIAERYAQKKKESNAMDFDDLLVNFLLLLNMSSRRKPGSNDDKDPGFRRDDMNVLEKYSCQFKYILVDEYQDTNKIQASIIDKMASVHRNVLVVGDDAQSIYSFRAAEIENILRFEEKYPDAKIFKLETNYRSTQEILDLANNVIANNSKQYKKNLNTLKSSGELPELQPKMDQFSEAVFIADKMKEHLDKGIQPQELAVLFRASHHSQLLEMELVKRRIAYDYRGGLRFFERAHVKDLLSYLRLLHNPSDSTAWFRVLLHEDGIGPVAAQKLVNRIRTINETEDIEKTGLEILGEKAKNGWKNFVDIWKKIIGVKQESPAEIVRAVLSSNYINYLESEYIDARERREDLEQLAVFAEQYENLERFLGEAILQESFGQVNLNNAKVEKDQKVILSTIHQAKGLEWNTVFLINLAGGGFPNSRALTEKGGLEEERRLFYVAITRAKENLYLTYPMTGGGAGDFASGPSIFLSEISSELLNDHSLLSYNSTVLDDNDADVHYVPEDLSWKPKPGSFLRDVCDL